MAAQTIREVMTRNPRTVDVSASIADAALLMREADVGSVVVTDQSQICGIVTDRDIAVRAVAMGLDPKSTPVNKICSTDPVTLAPDDNVGEVLRLMRSREVRRVPVIENGRPVGIVALGDLAVDRDPGSVLGDISAAPPNR
jgi:CBS domain-containing protein